MPKKFRLLQALAILINLTVAFCIAVLPHAFYYGVTLDNGQQPQIPFLAYYANWFYGTGAFFVLMSWFFWRCDRRWLRLPIGVYSFLTVFMALAQSRVFKQSVAEGLVLYAVTVLPLAVQVVLSFWLGRYRDRQ
ncbi:MAG: hypothetical protein AB7N80_12690 [Bdellovibrionales bacterium]